MSRSEYAKYLATQAHRLAALAEEVEAGGAVTMDWTIDWELRRESEFIDALPEHKKEDEAA